MKFDQASLKESLAKLAVLHKLDWKWDGSHYPKPVRSLGPDRPGLCASAPVLKEIATVAPNGFPDLACLISVWTALHHEHCILQNLPDTSYFSILRISEIWKKMLKDCLQIKKSCTTLADTGLQEVLDILQPHDPSGIDIPRNAEGYPDFDANSHEIEEDDEVEILGICCQCPECSAKCIIDIDKAAKDDLQIPSPAIGGQRLSTLEVQRPSASQCDKVKKRPSASQCDKDQQDKQGNKCKKFKLVHRVKDEKAYIMGDSYIVGLSKTRNSCYVEILKQCTELLEDGSLLDKESAKAWVKTVIAYGLDEQPE